MKNSVDIEEAYKFYLKKCDLSIATMHPTEAIERKKAFIAGYAMCFALITEEVSKMEDEKAFDALTKIRNQLLNMPKDY